MATPATTDPNGERDRRAPPVVGLVADDVTMRRLEVALQGSCQIVARSQTIDGLLDGERVPFDLAVLAGGGELLARGGPVQVLKRLRPACSVVVVATSEDTGLIRKALRCGADGFVFHSAAATALAPAVEAVRVGHLSVPLAIRRRPRWSQFSMRERQVLRLVSRGLTNSEIARRLFLSESTVKCHLSSGFQKLGVSSRAEAAAVVLDPQAGLQVGAA